MIRVMHETGQSNETGDKRGNSPVSLLSLSPSNMIGLLKVMTSFICPDASAGRFVNTGFGSTVPVRAFQEGYTAQPTVKGVYGR